MSEDTGKGGNLVKDLIAGLVGAVASVPSGLATASLAGVNPIAGIYTSIFAPSAGGLLVSAQRMFISATAASALAAGQAISGVPDEQRMDAIALVTVATGAFLALFWLLGAARLMKYVSHAVMTGFLIGVACVVIMDQTIPFAGYDPPEGNTLFQFWSLLTNLGDVHLRTVIVGAVAFALALILARTRLATFASIITMIVPALLVLWLGWSEVRVVADAGGMEGGFPLPGIPALSLITPDLILSAFSVAAIIAIQGAGVSQSLTNIDGKPISVGRDLLAQGAGNLAAGAFGGIPAGGSVGQTALNMSVGAQTRWASVACGVFLLLILLFFSRPVGFVPMTALAVLMIIAGIGAIDVDDARAIWAVGWTPRIAAFVTFLAGIVFSLTIAILVGIVLSTVLAVVRAGNDVRLRQLRREKSGAMVETDVPTKLGHRHAVMVINVYGSLFFAGARTLARLLPAPEGADRPVVILRLRGHSHVGATLVEVLKEYAGRLKAAGGRLYLTGLDPAIMEPLIRVCRLSEDKEVALYAATDRLGASTREAMEDAKVWRYDGDGPPAEEVGGGKAASATGDQRTQS
ncbi:SulP family inorganic anion transporter [Sabulicella glaciei]|uniref:SulP family inorganic anion transporter n=1 Tax=Sabulicella glaciei TaxID=2984948 RepID=A0ABT3P099_9PROT|nr:SulP family inorganic anion transporter [Roseococcus sp. MDT2-1-1]MCW8087835.1 SulP family inorganic anion transporter [Roseococcus sp. MDT2-1-1]